METDRESLPHDKTNGHYDRLFKTACGPRCGGFPRGVLNKLQSPGETSQMWFLVA